MSSIRTRLFMACESFLRVPPLLLVDEIFRTSFGLGGRFFKQNLYESSSSPAAQTVIIDSKESSTLFDSAGYPYFNESLIDDNPYLTESSRSDSEAAANASTDFSWPSLYEWLVGSGEFLKNQTNQLVEVTTESMKNTGENKTSSLLQIVSGEEFSNGTEEFAEDLMKFGEVLSCVVLFLAAVVMFMLATENLIKLYSHLLSFFTLYIAFVTSPISMAVVAFSSLPSLFLNLGFRTVLAALFFVSRSWPAGDPGDPVREDRTIVTSLTDPLLFSMFYISGVVSFSPVIYILILTMLHHSLISSLPKVYNFLVLSWGETKRIQNEYGLSHLIQVESGRLRINTVFRLFWMTRAAYDAFYRCCDEPISLIIRYVMTHGTETFTGIVGLTVTVAAICHQIGDFLLWILYFGANSEVDANRFGSISTVLFFILSLQTGLTSLDPEKRLDRLMKNIVLLGTALFHALHQMVSPLLHAFRSFQAVQIRAASISCTFLCVSCFLTLYLLRWTTTSTWSLAVLALAIEFKIKVIISLIISLVVYLSQLVQSPEIVEKFIACCRRVLPSFIMRFFDQLYDQISHEDMVFYLKTIANIAEFITGIFLFGNAVWIFLFESTSAIRAIGMSIHAYFNIWCEAQKGYRIYCQRKTASKKIMSLSDASEEQLRSRNDDVCSICYEGLESAKVTNCGHYFHAVCLRKWLYVQNTCPMCHEILYREEVIAEIEQGNPEPAEVLVPPQLPPFSPIETPLPEVQNQNGWSDNDEEPVEGNNRGAHLPEQNGSSSQAAGQQSDGNANHLQRHPMGTYEGVNFYRLDDLENDSDDDGNSSSEGEFVVNEIPGFGMPRNEVETDEEDDEAEEAGRQAHSRGLVVFL